MPASLSSTASSGPSGFYCQEVVYERITFLKQTYLAELTEMHQILSYEIQQNGAPSQVKPDELSKLKAFKVMLESIITFLHVSKSDISLDFIDKLAYFEKDIISFIKVKRLAKIRRPLQPGQLPPPERVCQDVYQKSELLKETYLAELNEVYQFIITKLQEHDSLPHQARLDKIEKLKEYKVILERIVTFLHVPKNISPNDMELLVSYEKQIINFINLNRCRKAMIPSSRQLLPPLMDWQEEIYRKITFLRENYLAELIGIYQYIATKLQQLDFLPQQQMPYQVDKMKVFKGRLESLITFLHVSKKNITPNHKEQLVSYEKQITNIADINRSRKLMLPLQFGKPTPPHMRSIAPAQSQVTQVHSRQNQRNFQLQTTNTQGSVAAMQQDNMASGRHITLFGVTITQEIEMNPMQ